MTFEKVAKIIAEYKEISPDEVLPTSRFSEDLGLDSLDTVELVMSLEEQFGITLEMDASLKTVQDLVDLIDAETDK